MQKKSKFLIVLIIGYWLLVIGAYSPSYAGPSSTNYELQEYQFGAAGTDTAFSSTNYKSFATLGEVEFGQISSSNFMSGNGLNYVLNSGVPPAPTLSNNSGAYYNKLALTINYSTSYASIPNDQLFAIAVSTNFSNPLLTQYVQTDHTLGSSIVWQSYTTWGGGSGFNIINLTPNTTYYAKIASKQGNFTETGFSPASTGVATSPTILSFSLRTVNQAVSPFTINLGTMTPGYVSTSSDQGKVTINTNAATGAYIYIHGSNSGLTSSSQGNYTIGTVSGSGQDLASLSQGYGVRGASVTQSSGNMIISGPYDGSGNVVGPVDTSERIIFTTDDAPVTNGVGQFEIRAKAALTAPPATDYTDTITLIAASAF